MNVEYFGLIGFGLIYAITVWLWIYAFYGKSVGSDKSKNEKDK